MDDSIVYNRKEWLQEVFDEIRRNICPRRFYTNSSPFFQKDKEKDLFRWISFVLV